MVKGINKSVIEITDTQNQYIEKAILFVNARYANHDRGKIEEMSREYLKSVDLPNYCEKVHSRTTRPSRKKYVQAVRALSLLSLLLIAAFTVLLIVK